jgi:transposase InsO family protein
MMSVTPVRFAILAAPRLESAHDRQRRRDNGSGLTSNAILAWPRKRGVEWRFNAPGKPMENGPRRKPQRRLRDECLSGQLSANLKAARRIIEE